MVFANSVRSRVEIGDDDGTVPGEVRRAFRVIDFCRDAMLLP